MKENDSTVFTLGLNQDPLCTIVTSYRALRTLPDGRLGAIKSCVGRYPEQTIWGRDESSLVAYDWETGEVEPLMSVPLPVDDGPGGFAWNPNMTLGVQEFLGLRGTLYWLTPNGARPMTATVQDGNRSFRLDENYSALASYSDATHATGLANDPDWSHDGRFIVFLANVDAIGKEGMYRSSGEWGLYVMDPVELASQKKTGGIYDPGWLSLAPDDRHVLLTASLGWRRQSGLWLINMNAGETKLVAAGEFAGAEWSPDGAKILSILCKSDSLCVTPEEMEFWEYDVSELVK